ncbi:hypothetical protein QTP88_010868 [Uroleucon formosanum]
MSNTAHKISNKESRKVVGELKPEDKMSIDSKSKQNEGSVNNESGKIDDTDQIPEDQISTDETLEEENRIDNNESGQSICKILNIVDDTDQIPEDQICTDETLEEENRIGNNESGQIDDTDQIPEDQICTDETLEEENRIDNNESGQIDDIDQISTDETSEQENQIDNIEFDIIDDTDQIPEDQICTDETLEEENRIGNNESGQIDDTDQIPEDQICTDETSEQENEIDNKESDKIDGELKSEYKICIINKSRIEDGPPPALKISNVEYGESSAILSIKKEMWIDNEEPDGSKNTLPNLFLLMLLINKIFNLGGAGHSLGDETCINYNTYDSDDRRQPTTIDEERTGEMWSSNSETLENTINSRKRYQNQNEGLNDNKQYLFKKIKIEDNNDESFLETLKRLECNSSNFNDWVDLLKIVDSQYNEEHARMAYSTFLNLYPLCYGYWKKYANFEKINSNMHEFEIVLENGLSAIPISVDLWIYYMTYLRTERYNETSHIRNEFERSLQFCGLDYHSDQLWYDYISWELLMNEPLNVIKIYHRLICIPTLNYLKNFFKFQEFIFNCLPIYYLEPDDYEQRQKRIIKSLETNRSNKLSNNDSMPPGEEFQQRTLIVEENVIFLMKIEIINEWHFFHKQTAKEFERRVIFEENIRRPHFHVNELDSAQIKNWENYIKFERRAGNHKRIIHLYERCLITCVSNEDFWLNYLEYLCFVNIDVAALLINVFERSLFHHPMSLLLNLKYFDYCETQGWVETAEKTIRKLETIYPDSREVSIKLINLARKCKDDKLEMSFKHYLNISQSKSFSSYIAVRYARFVWKHDRQLNLAFDILYDTIIKNNITVNDSLDIYLTLVELKMELNPKDHLSVLKTIDDIILQCNLYREKLLFSKKKVEYTEDYIKDYELLRLAKMEYEQFKNACFREKKTIMK